MPDAPVAFPSDSVLRRSRLLAFVVAAVLLYLPATLPYLLGHVADCGSCLLEYTKFLPVVPGLIVTLLVPDGGLGLALAAALTLLLLLAVTWMLHRLSPVLCYVPLSILAVLVALQGFSLAGLLAAKHS